MNLDEEKKYNIDPLMGFKLKFYSRLVQKLNLLNYIPKDLGNIETFASLKRSLKRSSRRELHFTSFAISIHFTVVKEILYMCVCVYV